MSWEDNGIDIYGCDDFDHQLDSDYDGWKTRDGRTINIHQMTNQHLYNAYKLKGNDRLQREILLRLFKKTFEDIK